MKVEYLDRFFEKCSNIEFLMKIRSVGAELLHADGQAGTPKQIVAPRTFSRGQIILYKALELRSREF